MAHEKVDYPIGAPFFPHHLLKEVMMGLLVFALLLSMVTFVPAPRISPADPYVTPEHIKPEWYFLASYQFLKICEGLSKIGLGQQAPKIVGVLGQGIVILLLFALPFLDRNPVRKLSTRRTSLTVGAVVVILFLVFTYWGAVS